MRKVSVRACVYIILWIITDFSLSIAYAQLNNIYLEQGQLELFVFGSDSIECVGPVTTDCSDFYDGNGSTRNNDVKFDHADYDQNNSTFNSTWAEFTLPVNSTVAHARLHWLGHIRVEQNANDCDLTLFPYSDSKGNCYSLNDLQEVEFGAVASGSNTDPVYSAITNESNESGNLKIDTNRVDRGYYGYSADVTNEVQTALTANSGAARFWVANVEARLPQPPGGASAGWALHIVLRNSSYEYKKIVITTGSETIGAGGSLDFSVNGFSTPSTYPPNAESSFSLIGIDGDLGGGDTFSFGADTSNTILISDPLHDSNDFMNGRHTFRGVYINDQPSPIGNRAPLSVNSINPNRGTIDMLAIEPNSMFNLPVNTFSAESRVDVSNGEFIFYHAIGLAFPVARVDRGDAPDSYGPVSHMLDSTTLTSNDIYLGVTSPDLDTKLFLDTGDASGDDGDNDDEDGITAPFPRAMLSPGDAYSIPNILVTNNTANRARLCGWLDFDINGQVGDGEFENSTTGDTIGERSCVTVNGVPDVGGDQDTGSCTGTGPQFNCQLDFIVPDDFVYKSDQITFLRLRVTSDPSFFTNASPSATGVAIDGEVEDYMLSVDTMPVTLSHFDSDRTGDRIDVDWGTSSELFNVGYQLWGLDGSGGEWHELHRWLVKSGSGNAVEPQNYSKSVKIPGRIDELVALGISSIDNDGSEHYYGPFEIGVSYGELTELEPIAWDKVRHEVDIRMQQKGYVKDRLYGYRKVLSEPDVSEEIETVVEFRVSEAGVYRITASELLAAGVDWSEVAKREIALLDHNGDAVVRSVLAKGSGTGLNKQLGSGGEIYFHGQLPEGHAGLYSEEQVYRLVLDRYRALEAQTQGRQGISDGLSEIYRQTVTAEIDQLYVFHTQVEDPWMERLIISYPDNPKGYLNTLSIDSDMIAEEPSSLTLNLGRGSQLPNVDLDADGVQDTEHKAQGYVFNSAGEIVFLDTEQAVGIGQWHLEYPIPAGTALGDAQADVIAGAIFSAGTGYAFSEVQIDSIGLNYYRPTIARTGDDHLYFNASDDNQLGYKVHIPNQGWPVVFAAEGGNLVRIIPESAAKVDINGYAYRAVKFMALEGAGILGEDSELSYWVSSKSAALSVEGLHSKSVATPASMLSEVQGADYLLITHPAFMGVDSGTGRDYLNEYVQFKQGQGHLPAVVDYLSIMDSFGGGQAGPHGLTKYLRQVEAQGDIKNILLVGGSVYDHTDNLDSGAVTFIPAHYSESRYSRFTPGDTPFIQDDEGRLFAAIGRWPVRTIGDVGTLVDKSIAWSSEDHSQGSALLIAENMLEGEWIDFAGTLDWLATDLPAGWDITRVYVDQVAEENGLVLPQQQLQALSLSKAQIINELNAGHDVVMYNGHANTSRLSNNGLFLAYDVRQLNQGGAEMWLPMSCYVTYYESTHVNTLAHQLLFTGNAVTISGAMLLSSQYENVTFGAAVLNGLDDGLTLGDTVMQYKTQRNSPSVKINWSILGDPSVGL